LIGTVSYYFAKQELINAGKMNLQDILSSAKSTIENLDQEVKMGRLSLEEAQEKARLLLLGPPTKDGKRDFGKTPYHYKKLGYVFGNNSKGHSVLHPTLLVGTDQLASQDKNLRFIVQNSIDKSKLPNKDDHFYIYMFKNKDETAEREKIAYVDYYEPWDWNLGIGAYTEEFYESLNQLKKVIVIMVALSVIVCFVAYYIMIRKRIVSIQEIQLTTDLIADGDLRVKALKASTNDEISKVAESVNIMASNLRTLIGKIGDFSSNINAYSAELFSSVEQSTKASDEIVKSVQMVASGAEYQSQGTRESTRAMEEIAQGTQRIADLTSTVSENMLATSKEASLGNETIQSAVKQMSLISREVDDFSTVIRQLGELSKQINVIIGMITDIANQTNLLALNASIEAARAGEHGRGFAVVANEIRKLADRTAKSTNQISDIIKEIQHKTDQSEVAVEAVTKEVKKGILNVHDAGETFQRIVKSGEYVTGEIQEVSAAVQQISAGSEQVVSSLIEMTRISQNNTDNSCNVATASQKQLLVMEQISASADELSHMAKELRQTVDKFNI
jgi:methyl-accepting chemotaxis protein